MRVREEGKISGDKSRPFRDLIQEHLLAKLGDSRLAPTQQKVMDALSLGQIRGQVIVLQDFDGDWVEGAMHYDSMDRESFWDAHNEADLAKKKAGILTHLTKANDNKNGLFLTALSAVGKQVGGVKGVAKEMNPVPVEHARWKNADLATTFGFGLIIADFPGPELIQATINKNPKMVYDLKHCVRLQNVADEVCNWANPKQDYQPKAECERQCKERDDCRGYQFRERDQNCDLILTGCGAVQIKGTKGVWSYTSKACFVQPERNVARKTGCNVLRAHTLEFLDRHNVQCAADENLTGFHVKQDSCGGENMRFLYSCKKAKFDGEAVERRTSCTNMKGRKLEYLDRQTDFKCSEGEVLKGFQLTKGSCSGRDMQFKLTCQKLQKANGSVTKQTDCGLIRGETNEYLDRHPLSCPDNKALSSFRLVKNGCSGNDRKFEYTCL